MRTISIQRFLLCSWLALLVAPTAKATNGQGGSWITVQVGSCLHYLQSYPTISGAVSNVPPDSIILVCPGNYPEQVTISKPLTLRGVEIENAANPIITVPSGGLTRSVTAPANGITMFFQILVQGTETGQVNISHLAIDGSNNNVAANGWIAGVYYQNSSGTVKDIATYNQMGDGLGFGIFLESTTSSLKKVAISTSSIHDFDAEGIRTNGDANLSVDIRSNSVLISPSPTLQINGIDIYGVGTVADNTITTRPGLQGRTGIGIAALSGLTVSNNTIAGMVIGIWPLGNSNVVLWNKVSLADDGIVVTGNDNDVEHNFLMNFSGGDGVSLSCTSTGNTVSYNLINDSDSGITGSPANNTITGNSFSNVMRLVLPPC